MDNAFLGTILAWPANFAPRGWAYCYGQYLDINQFTTLYSLLGTVYGGDGRSTFALPDLRGRTVVGSGKGPALTLHILGQWMGYEKIPSPYLLANHNHEIPSSGMSVNLDSAKVNMTAAEMDLNLQGRYGVPITSSSDGATGMPSDSDHYLGTPKMPNGSPLNAYYTSASQPTVTTKSTAISVSGKVTPIINSSMSGAVDVKVTDELTVSQTGSSRDMYLNQPSLSLNYIICIDGMYPPRS